ncbi:DEAD/DEAH box helicase [Parvularcula dongshanensis]|uniref:DEAD-box ATP-dependent RNA helicase RhpA n=1 Tax=Parvularcula dongshanensis TaxID=1173995 RepID=A0A840I2U5_9PROT|nr:DEAD/DEAH box helicase [Parvularcula dongshanensis]MBB4658370.1 superfamily II DNA/RNA helicase [Parvularcula dongshanensis]
MKFVDLGLEPKTLQGVMDAGYDEPTPIQAKAIPEALQGRDVLGIAQTGTGKTAAFTIPMIHRLSKGRAKARMPRSLVLAPTRELAMQVAESFEKYGKYHKLSMALLIGGVSFKDQEMKLTRGVDVLVATPGRLLDHHERGKLLLTGIEVMVVDEADRMLDMGFIPDLERIFNLLPFTRQTLFFSATMPDEITRITNQFLSAPTRVEVSRPAQTAETIRQLIVKMPQGGDALKRATLRKVIDDAENLQNGIVFCNRKRNVDVVAKSLQKHGYDARPIHGDLAQAFRMETLKAFRDGELKLLIASDVAARGLDIPEVSHVFNFDVPVNSDDYVHRIGRTGRAGRKGTAVMLVTPNDTKQFDAVLKTTSQEGIEEADLGDFFETVEVEEKPRRKRSELAKSGTRSRSRKKPADEKVAEEPKPEKVEEKSEAAAEAPKDEPRKTDKRDDDRRSSRGGRGRSRRDDGPAMSHGDRVVGFGDHVPAFILRDDAAKAA